MTSSHLPVDVPVINLRVRAIETRITQFFSVIKIHKNVNDCEMLF